MKLRHLITLSIFSVCLPRLAAKPATEDIIHSMKRVADWQMENPSKHPITDWTQAPFFLGLYNLHQVSQDGRYLKALEAFGNRAQFGPGKRIDHADDHAVLQAWLELYKLKPEKKRLSPSIGHFPKVLKVLKQKTRFYFWRNIHVVLV